MKLIIRDFVASLKERNELDKIIPDLLSSMGLHVFTKPKKPGYRQYGVDVGAFGVMPNDLEAIEKVYLFSIKGGDLNRQNWDTGQQSLRTELNEIIDTYIPTMIPRQYKKYDVVICPTFGGQIGEDVRLSFSTYVEHESRVTFCEWNGEVISDYIMKYLLNDRLLSSDLRVNFNKTLAMIQSPDISLSYFNRIIDADVDHITMKMVLWILYVWSRNEEHFEVAFQGTERVVLKSWGTIVKTKKIRSKETVKFNELLELFFQVSESYFLKYSKYAQFPYVLSSAIKSNSYVDINLQLFALLGKLSSIVLWCKWREARGESVFEYAGVIKLLIDNNPVLTTPLVESQIVSFLLATLAILLESKDSAVEYVVKIYNGISTCFFMKNDYLTYDRPYYALLKHSTVKSPEYIKDSFSADVFIPYIVYLLDYLDKKEPIQDIERSFPYLMPKETQYQLPITTISEGEELYFSSQEEFSQGLTSCLFDKSRTISENVDYVNTYIREHNFLADGKTIGHDYTPLFMSASRQYEIPLPVQIVAYWLNFYNGKDVII